ncbi:solute carrier family 35 member E1-like [Patiria miniata]|uniref:Sugar phosphate transporter domain-containing protein n=1 Tax=Patiria miniata TaxID=46514 RepID=A0A914AXS8_PATMI|nr:solute carrier family 35 member E1-like [Patiria miniata]
MADSDSDDTTCPSNIEKNNNMAGTENIYRFGVRIFFLCVMWYTSSLLQNVINKHLFGQFPYPTTVSMCHMLAVAVLLAPVLRLWNVPQPDIVDKRSFYQLIVPLAFGKFFSSVSAEISILKVSISFAHTVKATMPIFTVLLSRLILKEKQTTTIYLSLIPIIFGVMVATLTEASFDVLGLTMAVVATVTFALQNVYSKKALRDIGIHHLRLLLIISQLASVMLLPIWMVVDLRRILRDRDMHHKVNWVWTLSLLLTSGAFNFLQNIFAFSILHLISPLSYSIANATKRIFVIMLSLLMLRNPVTLINVMGMMTAIFGVLCYNLAKYRDNLVKHRPFLPTVQSDLLDGRIIGKPDMLNGRPHYNV